MSDVGLVLAAGGSGQRFDPQRNKLLLNWRGLALFCHPLRAFLPLLRPGQVIVVAPPGAHGAFREAMTLAGLPAEIRLVAAGHTRQESVANGIAALPPAAEIVAIQDGARPCTPAALLLACVKSARERGSGVAARRVTDTIKMAAADGRVVSTPDRATLRAAETPQVFRRALIERGLAFVREHGITVTDDAQALEAAGAEVYLVEHTFENPKVTHPGDLARLDAHG